MFDREVNDIEARDTQQHKIEYLGTGIDFTEQKRHQLEMMDGQYLFNNLFDQLDIGVAYIALNGQLLKCNRRFCEIFGYTATELNYLTFLDITHLEDRQAILNAFQELLTGTVEKIALETSHICKNGSIVSSRLKLTSIFDEKHQESSFLILLEDVSESKQLQEDRNRLLASERAALEQARVQAQQLEAIFEVMVDGMIIYDGQGNIVKANAAARSIFPWEKVPDYTQRSAQSRIPYNFLRDESGNPISREEWPLTRILRGEVLKGATTTDIFFRLADGRDLQLSLSGSPLYDDENHIIGVVSLFRDVTERRRLERETKDAVQALRKANQLMDDFLSMTSHELRSPIAAIKGNLQLAERRLLRIQEQIETQDEQQMGAIDPVFELLNLVDGQLARLNRLVNDLLDASRIQVNKMVMYQEYCDLVAIMKEAVEEHRMVVPKHQISTTIPVGQQLSVYADADRIKQVLINYLSNAHKYSPEDRPIEVSLTVDNDYAIVAVTDKGPGLPVEEHTLIWDRFHQAKSVKTQVTHRNGAGLGLGLYISRTIIEHHNGRVGVQSAPGMGSTFWFTLPLLSAPV